jgi:pimeloyl-ACP methyl ester carboxylesterase
MSGTERSRALSIIESLSCPDTVNKNELFGEFGALFARADAYDALFDGREHLEAKYDSGQRAWKEAEELRRSGALLKMGNQITCPVVAIHGDYDSHPAEGVERPLSRVLRDFRFVLLEKCGHSPWLERQARDRFYDILKGEIE